MTRAHRRIGPFEEERARPVETTCRAVAQGRDARSQRSDHGARFFGVAGDVAQERDRRKHVAQRCRLERDDTRIGAQPFRGRVDDVVGYGADGAQLLRHDQVGHKPLE
ncbi:MAG TPA: hypothetical protein VHT92_03095 [Candidatus Cybelea sp.]|nr:hypothetical protein [Candidatus Cybelea sp.]